MSSPARNLAYWLYKIHPPIFAVLYQQAPKPRATLARFGGLAALGQDGFDTSSAVSDILNDTTPGTLDVSPDLSSLDPPAIESVSLDTSGMAVPTFTTQQSWLSTVGTGIGDALTSVGSFLTSKAGLTSVSNLATAYYKANTPQQAAIQTQVGRVQAGVNPAPITYGYNSAGQVVPVLQQPNTAGFSLSPQALAGLVPATWQPYVVPVVIGLVVYSLLSSRKR